MTHKQVTHTKYATGMTLLEVILALALFGGSIAVIGQMARMSFQNAQWARDLIQAELLAESILAKVRLGTIEMETAYDIPVSSYVDQQDVIMDTHAVAVGNTSEVLWFYSLEILSIDDYLVEIAVTVRQSDSASSRPAACRLVRWLAIEPEIEEEEETETE